MLIFLMCAVCPVVGISAALVIARVTNGEWPSRGPSGAARTIGASCAGCCALSWTDKSKRMRLHKIADVPEVMRRPGILGGYRLGLTNAECVRSFLTVTNEVANQWTHSLPMLWACWAAFSEWQLYTQGSISLMELGIAVAYFGTILFCFGSSVIFHTFGCKSGQVCWDLCHIDHVGVVLGTLAGYFPGLYYGERCSLAVIALDQPRTVARVLQRAKLTGVNISAPTLLYFRLCVRAQYSMAVHDIDRYSVCVNYVAHGIAQVAERRLVLDSSRGIGLATVSRRGPIGTLHHESLEPTRPVGLHQVHPRGLLDYEYVVMVVLECVCVCVCVCVCLGGRGGRSFPLQH
jgi:hypothetical protein